MRIDLLGRAARTRSAFLASLAVRFFVAPEVAISVLPFLLASSRANDLVARCRLRFLDEPADNDLA